MRNGKLEREYLVSLGYITKTEAKLELAKYLTLNKNRGKGDITLKQAHTDFNKYYINSGLGRALNKAPMTFLLPIRQRRYGF